MPHCLALGRLPCLAFSCAWLLVSFHTFRRLVRSTTLIATPLAEQSSLNQRLSDLSRNYQNLKIIYYMKVYSKLVINILETRLLLCEVNKNLEKVVNVRIFFRHDFPHKGGPPISKLIVFPKAFHLSFGAGGMKT